MAEVDSIGVDASPKPVGAVTRKCALCSSEVSVKSEPFLLPCLHTACKACLPEHQSVQCGYCEQTFPSAAAIRHLVLLERLEKESPEEESDSIDSGPKHLCTSCDEGVAAAGYCKDCEEWLCSACMSAHKRVKVTKDHTILSTEQAGRALKAAAKQRFQMCTKHPKEPLKFYCSKCSALTCRDCQLVDHQNHGDYLALAAAWEQQKPHLKILQERIAEKQAFVREYVASLEKCQDVNAQSESRAIADIRAYAVRAITLINARAKKLIREIQDICSYKRDALSYKRLEFLQLCKRLLDCHAAVDDLISTGSELALMHSKVAMEQYMSGLIEKVVQLPSTKAEIHIKFHFEPKVLDALANTGQIVDLSSLREPPLHSLRAQLNGQQSRPNSASGIMPNGRSAPSPSVSSKSGSPHSLSGVSSAGHHLDRPPSASLREREHRRPTPAASPLENGSKDDVITGDVEPPTGSRRAPSPVSVSTAIVAPASDTGSAPAPVCALEPARTVSAATPRAPQTTAELDTHPIASDDNDNSDDWCAVCHDGGELLCCGLCPKVYHLHCHVPSLVSTPSEDWKCTLCSPVQDESSPATSKDGAGKRKIPVGLSGKQLKLAEKILLQLFCHASSTPFQTPVSRTVPNYFKIITRPMDLSTVKQKLSASHFNHYESATTFIQDIKLIFSNCYTFNAKESPLAKQAQLLEEYFKQLIEKELPECINDLKEPSMEESDIAKKAKVA
ncbi:E3 ubiquitin-protein ligase TRIM33-like [Tropilaelaps mercedesae]|uniref:E3 ubiquitin-protein ligase TRIM33-like n=1 Tax=Tropilaelaps mercedesae TaxID=418985 RepID=A0A1V9XE40_9ACAR|nr:E3 ubiquitin-protein ligase TRIM33-like [Tropilaelaps mercedesae]